MTGIEFREYPPRPVRLVPTILLLGLFGGAGAGVLLLMSGLTSNATVFGSIVVLSVIPSALIYGGGLGLLCGVIALLTRWIVWLANRQEDRFDILAIAGGTIIGSILNTIVLLVPIGGWTPWQYYAGITLLATLVFALVARKARKDRHRDE